MRVRGVTPAQAEGLLRNWKISTGTPLTETKSPSSGLGLPTTSSNGVAIPVEGEAIGGEERR